uniref:Uncharacterized protein n=1 Tax=Anguilla anguilla TaxID=7936 RepID=A0A0E9UYR8_ANGAN
MGSRLEWLSTLYRARNQALGALLSCKKRYFI